MKYTAEIRFSTRGYNTLYVDGILIADIDSNHMNDSAIIQNIHNFSSANGLAFRVYKTFAGIRAICISHHFRAATGAAERILRGLLSDEKYIKICKSENYFAARIDPKPERVGISIAQKFNFYDMLPMEQDAWMKEFKEKKGGFRVCEYITQTSIDEDKIPSPIKNLVKLHDERTLCHTSLPLA